MPGTDTEYWPPARVGVTPTGTQTAPGPSAGEVSKVYPTADPDQAKVRLEPESSAENNSGEGSTVTWSNTDSFSWAVSCAVTARPA